MLSDAERRKLAEIESLLRAEDPRFARHMDSRPRRRRRIAVVMALVAVAVTVLALVAGSVLGAVAGLVALGVAVGIWVGGRGRQPPPP